MKRDHDEGDEGVEVALHHDYPFLNPDFALSGSRSANGNANVRIPILGYIPRSRSISIFVVGEEEFEEDEHTSASSISGGFQILISPEGVGWETQLDVAPSILQLAIKLCDSTIVMHWSIRSHAMERLMSYQESVCIRLGTTPASYKHFQEHRHSDRRRS